MIVVGKPSYFDIDDIAVELKEIFESGIYSNFGPQENLLNLAIAEDYPGHVLTTSNGTIALMSAIEGLNITNGKLLIQDYSFVATAQAAAQMGCEFEFVDVNRDTTLSIEDLKSKITDEIVGVIVVPAYGIVPDMTAIKKICDKHGLKLIVDAAHAYGVKDLNIANIDAVCFSLHPTKLLNTFEGGAVVFDDPAAAVRARQYLNFGLDQSNGLSTMRGINGKMNEFSALVARKNITKVPLLIAERKGYAKYLSMMIPNTNLFEAVLREASNYSYFPIQFSCEDERDQAYKLFFENNILARKYFYPTQSQQPIFRKYSKLPNEVSISLSKRVLALPLHNRLTGSDKELIQRCIRKIF